MSHRMLYKCPGPFEIHRGHFDTVTVPFEEVEAKLAEGWFMTTPEAKAAHEAKLAEDAKAAADARDDAPPTRDELVAKAAELGIEHHPLLGDKKLAALIAEKLKA